jgi:hypothetical protein
MHATDCVRLTEEARRDLERCGGRMALQKLAKPRGEKHRSVVRLQCIAGVTLDWSTVGSGGMVWRPVVTATMLGRRIIVRVYAKYRRWFAPVFRAWFRDFEKSP